MKLKYKEAMENLQAMFQNFDQETIHSILVMHKGAVQPTIEDLLRLSNEQEQEDNDNMFANDNPSNSNSQQNGLGDDFLDPNLVDADSNEYYARKIQEKEDMKMAMALQQKYMASEKQQQQQQQYQQEGEGEDDAQQETYDAQAMMKSGGYKKFGDESSKNKGKKVGLAKRPLQEQQVQQQQPEENQEVISFDLNEQENQNGFVFHQYNGEEMKNNGLNSQFEEMKVNDEDNDFKTDTKGIDTKKKKSFWTTLFGNSKKTKGSN